MDQTTALLALIHSLGSELDTDEPDGDTGAVEESLAAVVGSVQTAVASYRGLQLTITQHGYPFVLTVLSPPEGAGVEGPPGPCGIATSLRLPLALLGADFEIGSQIVFYAATSGAFVDLAADLDYALTAETTGPLRATERGSPRTSRWATAAVGDHTRAITLDGDLQPVARTSGASGLAELSAINRAVGFMIDRGHHPDDVHRTLRRQAAAAGLTPYAFAAGMLRRSTSTRSRGRSNGGGGMGQPALQTTAR